MNPQDNNTGLGMPQGANGMGALPPIQSPPAYPASVPATPQFGAVGGPQAVPPNLPPAPLPQQPQPQVAPPAPAAPPVSPAPSTPPASSSQSTDAGPIDDGDTAFDEEWVGKAKAVVSQTHADPYLQSQELSKLKAQYIKLRYNKDIKVSE